MRRKKEILFFCSMNVFTAFVLYFAWPYLLNAIHHHLVLYADLAVYPALGIGLLFSILLIIAHATLAMKEKLNRLSVQDILYYLLVGLSLGFYMLILVSLGIIYMPLMLIGLLLALIADGVLLTRNKAKAYNIFIDILTK